MPPFTLLLSAGLLASCTLQATQGFLGGRSYTGLGYIHDQSSNHAGALLATKRGGSTATEPKSRKPAAGVSVRPQKRLLDVQIKPQQQRSAGVTPVVLPPLVEEEAEEMTKQEDSEPLTVTSATAVVAGTTVGAGILALPAYCIKSGFLPSSGALIGAWLYMVRRSVQRLIALSLVDIHISWSAPCLFLHSFPPTGDYRFAHR